jgi:hypothetical protein
MMENMEIWDKVRTPPQTALKEIKGGRMSGKTDISPQWRMQALTEVFGPAGFGWTYEITDKWTEKGPLDQVAGFVNILLFVKMDGEWSRGIPGTGGSMLVTKESSGLHFSDEVFKMATTDAISVAAKALGVASDVYMGVLDSKYQPKQGQAAPAPKAPQKSTGKNFNLEKVLKQLGESQTLEALDAVITNWKPTIDGWNEDDKKAARATYATVKALVIDPHRNEPGM